MPCSFADVCGSGQCGEQGTLYTIIRPPAPGVKVTRQDDG